MDLFRKGLTIIFGSLLIAIGINGFLVPYGLLEGGAIGISLIIHYVANVKVGLTFLLISIPIFIMAWYLYRSFFYNGLHGMLCSSLLIDVFSSSTWLSQFVVLTPFFSALIGGMIIGVGVGIMLRSEVSIGGLDLLAQMLAKKMAINTGIVILTFDILVVTVGRIIVRSTPFLLSLLTVLVIGLTISIIVATKRQKTKVNRAVYEEVKEW